MIHSICDPRFPPTRCPCEGLNLQTLGTLVNVDLPWNPSRLEQRIGRIKRFGQRRDRVDMLNLVYHSTVDAKVYETLSERMCQRGLRTPLGRGRAERSMIVARSVIDDLESPRIFLGMSHAVLVAKTVPAGWDAVQAGVALTRLLG